MNPFPEDKLAALKFDDITLGMNVRQTKVRISLEGADGCPSIQVDKAWLLRIRDRMTELAEKLDEGDHPAPENREEAVEIPSIGTVLGERLRQEHQNMRELAEIGRLAVEDRTKALASGKAPEHRRQSTYLAYTNAHVALAQACDAYLAKEPKP